MNFNEVLFRSGIARADRLLEILKFFHETASIQEDEFAAMMAVVERQLSIMEGVERDGISGQAAVELSMLNLKIGAALGVEPMAPSVKG
jgi:hypothetical protein